MKNKIGYKLVITIVLFSSLITFITASIQIYIDYRMEIKKIDNYETLIREGYLKSITASVWRYDETQINTQLNGILHLPDMEQLEINSDGGFSWSVGHIKSKRNIIKEFDLWYTHRNDNFKIGVLHAVINLDSIYAGLFRKALTILVSNAIKTFLVSGFILLIVQSLFTRHLYKLSSWLQNLDIGKSFEKFQLDRRVGQLKKHDELDEVVMAINQMQDNLKTSLSNLIRSENKYKILTENIPLKVFHKDTDSVYIACNNSYAKDLKIKADQIAGMTDFDFFPKELAEKYQSDDRNIVASKKIGTFEEEYFPPSEGKKAIIRTIKAPIWDGNGNITGLIGAFIDVTELKITKNALQQSEEKFRRLLESLKESYFFYSHDTSRQFLYLSPSITNVLGYSDKDFFNKHYTTYLTDSPVNKEALRHMELSCQGIQQPPYEIEILHKNGNAHQLRITETPVFGEDGKVISVEGLAHDVTDIKRIENQLRHAQKMEAIGTLAGGIAHDFNNILSVILGYAELAKDDACADSPVLKNLDKVLEAGHKAKELVKQILAFSRQSEIRHIPLAPAAIIKESLKMLRHSIPVTIDIHEQIDSDCDFILADPTQIHQIVMNLCTNAFHAMEYTGGAISIYLRNHSVSADQQDINIESLLPGKYVELIVKDTGPGIMPDIQEKIFNPYFTTKEVGKGTGMGLSIVHGIMQSYGGDIKVESTLGKGSVFHLFFPVTDKRDATTIVNMNVEKGSERILFIDDEDFLVDMGKNLLSRLGYKVTALKSSIEALDIFRKKPDQFDLVITDQTMPGLTGADLAREMLQIRPDIPVILCTGYSATVSEEKAKAMGIREFVFKPILQKDIAILIRKVLDAS